MQSIDQMSNPDKHCGGGGVGGVGGVGGSGGIVGWVSGVGLGDMVVHGGIVDDSIDDVIVEVIVDVIVDVGSELEVDIPVVCGPLVLGG